MSEQPISNEFTIRDYKVDADEAGHFLATVFFIELEEPLTVPAEIGEVTYYDQKRKVLVMAENVG